jgi:hypothetical protein
VSSVLEVLKSELERLGEANDRADVFHESATRKHPGVRRLESC